LQRGTARSSEIFVLIFKIGRRLVPRKINFQGANY